ncbi:MAG: AraC family transcriptional regulator [Firmicutes bacterium]|nr:AraC family transcriptional regulator [Bacillota bacterium]NLL87404.1 AraC family transcriptional regulator [Bacillota bacterium]
MNPDRFYYEISPAFSFYHSVTTNPEGFDIHIHRSYELLYFVSGNATYHIEGQTYQMEPGDLIFTNTRELHKIIFHSDDPYERKFIQFKPEFILGLQVDGFNPLAVFENRKPGHNNKINAEDVRAYKIDRYIEALHKYAQGGTSVDNVMIKTTLIQMLVAINQVFQDKYQGEQSLGVPNAKINAILAYINGSLHQRITLDDLEKAFYINKYHLCHIFKQNTGFAILEYISYKRILRAKELLAEGQSAAEAAVQVGYSDYSTFFRAFKNIVGISPNKYKKRSRERQL